MVGSPTGWSVRTRQIAPVALVLGLTIAGFFGARLLGERDARRNSERRAEVAAAQIHGRVQQGAALAESLRRFMASPAETGVTDEAFESNASRWLSPAGFPAAAWVERVPATRREQYERRLGHPIVTRDRRRRIVPAGSRSAYLAATLVSGIPPMAVPGIDLGGERGIARALARASSLDDTAATPLATLRDGTKGLFLTRSAPRLTADGDEPGFVVVFASDSWLRAAATDTATSRLTSGNAPAAEGASVRRSFTEAGQRFDVAVPQEPVRGAAAVLPWILLAAGLVAAVLAGALGVSAARRARAQDELDRIFTLSSDPISVADLDGRFTRVNPATERVLDYPQAELVGRPYLDFVHPDERERTAAAANAIGQRQTTLSFENRFLRKDGADRVLAWTATPDLENGHVYWMARDVTERRKAESELERLVDEQRALRRVATLIARAAPSEELFNTVSKEVGTLFGADLAGMSRYEDDDTMTILPPWSAASGRLDMPGRVSLESATLPRVIRDTGRPAREDAWDEVAGEVAELTRDQLGIRSAVGSPIVVEGRVWGALFVSSTQTAHLPEDTESRLENFTELVGTAIANAQARAEVQRLAEEQAALRRVATLVAEGAPPTAVFDAVAGEMAALLDADQVALNRFEPSGEILVLAHRGLDVARTPVGSRVSLEGESVTAIVRRTGRPARMESYEDVPGALAQLARETGLRVSVGAPVAVDGRLWGIITASWKREESPPAETEDRMARFAELLDTAIANAETRAELMASRARVVAASDDARRRFERDLHDGVQQRLVSVSLELSGAKAMAPLENEDLAVQLAQVGEGLAGALDDLRELSRGIHPAILSEGGLVPALKVLARRSAVPVQLDLAVAERLDDHVEVGAYYVVSEALTNVAKHARASIVEVKARASDGVLELTIDDDGVGGADPAQGSGLIGLVDRVEALGGTIAIESPPGGGTALRVDLPLVGR
jgi:PAS domain S-box-containing protein